MRKGLRKYGALIPASNEPSGCDSIHLANAARINNPDALQRIKLDAPLLAAGLLTCCCLLLAGCGSSGGQESANVESISAESQNRESGNAEKQSAESQERESGNTASQSVESQERESGNTASQSAESPNTESRTSEEQADQPSKAGQAEALAEEAEASSEFEFTICFAGDINLDESSATTLFMDSQEDGIYDCISPELIAYMNDADIMCLNNEFTYSTGGAPLEGKKYTFRADPARVEILKLLGVDAVTLANNHVYDYGKEALLDTFAVLEEAEISYFGAGRTLEDAIKPLYIEADGRTVALVGASRAEKYKMTPQATETEPGILRCYDTELYKAAIAEAKENADVCIACVHWGTEYSFDLEQVQLDTGKEYLDAGADAVIGAHSHCLQGLEYYQGKPICYSLGNYWFNKKTLDTMLVQLHFSGDDLGSSLWVEIIPATQTGCRTVYAAEEEERRRIFDFLEDISVNVEITDEGIVKEIP